MDKSKRNALADDAAAYLMMLISATCAGMATRSVYVGISVFFALKVISSELARVYKR